MLKILNKFLLRRFFAGFGTVMFIVCGIIFAITFVERLPNNPTIFANLFDSWKRLLEYIPLFLPLAVFMGTLLAYYNLTKSSEGIIVSSAGLSPFQSSKPFLIGAALIGIFATMVINPYSVRLSAANITADNLTLIDNAIWLRETSQNGVITMRAENMRVKDKSLFFQKVAIFTQNPEFKLTQRIESKEVELSENGLYAKNAIIWGMDGIPKKSEWNIKTRLNPQTVLDRYLQPNQISFWELPGFIKKMKAIGVPVRAHMVQLWTLLFLPLTMIALSMLGVAFSQTKQRRNYSFGLKFGIGIITCFGLYFMVNMFAALGSTGALPTLLAVIAPPIIIIAFAGFFISTFDSI